MSWNETALLNYKAKNKSLSYARWEINPEYSLEGLRLKLKLQYFDHPMRTANSLEKISMLGKIEGRKRRGQQRMTWLDGITDSMDMNLGKPGQTWEMVRAREAWSAAVHEVTRSQTQLGDWTTTMKILVWPHRVRHSPAWYIPSSSFVSRSLTPWRKWSSPFPASFDYKTVAHLILRAELPNLPTCVSYKQPILINLYLFYQFASCWIPSMLRHKAPEPQEVQTADEWSQLNDRGSESHAAFCPGLSPRTWV